MTPGQGQERDRIKGEILAKLTPRMMPGSEPYTDAELTALYRMISQAAEADPGEHYEAAALEIFNRQTHEKEQ